MSGTKLLYALLPLTCPCILCGKGCRCSARIPSQPFPVFLHTYHHVLCSQQPAPWLCVGGQSLSYWSHSCFPAQRAEVPRISLVTKQCRGTSAPAPSGTYLVSSSPLRGILLRLNLAWPPSLHVPVLQLL